MAEQIKLLSQETKDLRKQLKEAREQLSRKDLELGKGRLTTLDGDLKMNRELDKVATKLKASEAKNKALEKELESTAGLQERIKVLEDQLKAAGIGAPAPAPKPKPTPAPKPKPTPAPKPKPTPAPKPEPTPAPKPEPTPAPKPEPTPAPAPEPFFAAEKSPAPKKKAAAPKGSAAKAASPKAAKSPAPKAKKAKAKAKTAAPAPAPGGDDWPSLSKSTLSRKTVIELTEYLSAKVCTTAGRLSIHRFSSQTNTLSRGSRRMVKTENRSRKLCWSRLLRRCRLSNGELVLKIWNICYASCFVDRKKQSR
jgi:hypothetical protein